MPQIETISIDDFKGGRNNFYDQLILENNIAASGTYNVWAPDGPLTKAAGLTLRASTSASGTTYPIGFWYDENANATNQLYYFIGATSTGSGGAFNYPFASSYIFTDSLTPLGYTTGTVAVGGVSATGSGTSWLANVTANDRFQSNQNKNGWYIVSSIEDNTHLTLGAAVPTAIGAGTSYTIQPSLGGSLTNPVAMSSLNAKLLFSLVPITNSLNPILYDGTGTLRLSVAPDMNFLTVFQGYTFGGRSNNFPSRVFWSALSDQTTWPSNNFIDVDLLNGKVTGLLAFGQELIVFKTHGMYKIVGSVFDSTNPTFSVYKISTPPDFIFNSNYSVVIHTTQPSVASATQGISYTNTILIFYASGKFYKYQQGTQFISDISRNVLRDLPESFSNPADDTSSSDANIRAVSFNGYYLCKGLTNLATSISGGSYNAMMLDRNMSWWRWMVTPGGGGSSVDEFDTTPFAVIPAAASSTMFLGIFGGQITDANHAFLPTAHLWTMDLTGPVYGTNFYSDSVSGGIQTSAINGIWQSKEFNIEFGTFKWIVVYFQKQSAGSLTIQWSIDQGSNVSYTQDMTIGRGRLVRAVIPLGQKGSTIQLTISNNTLSQTFKIYAIKIMFEPSDRERIL